MIAFAKRYGIYPILLLYAAGVVAVIYADPRLQWDFEAYYYGAMSWAQGVSPYGAEAVDRASDGASTWRFIYTPITVYAFLPFTALDLVAAKAVFLTLKLLALAGLVTLWYRMLSPRLPAWVLLAVCIFGFNAAIYADLRVGNITIFEQLVLWTGIWAYLQKKPYLAAAAIALAAVPKLALLPFLLLLIAPARRQWRAFGFGLSLFILLVAGPFIVRPELVGDFVSGFGREFHHRAPWAQSPLTFIGDITALQVVPQALNDPRVHVTVFALYAVMLLAVSWPMLRASFRQPPGLGHVIHFCFIYALLMPRFKDYSYILLILPAIVIATTVIRSLDARVIAVIVLALAAPIVSPLPYSRAVLGLLWSYYPLLLTLTVWLLYVREEKKTPGANHTQHPQAPTMISETAPSDETVRADDVSGP